MAYETHLGEEEEEEEEVELLLEGQEAVTAAATYEIIRRREEVPRIRGKDKNGIIVSPSPSTPASFSRKQQQKLLHLWLLSLILLPILFGSWQFWDSAEGKRLGGDKKGGRDGRGKGKNWQRDQFQKIEAILKFG